MEQHLGCRQFYFPVLCSSDVYLASDNRMHGQVSSVRLPKCSLQEMDMLCKHFPSLRHADNGKSVRAEKDLRGRITKIVMPPCWQASSSSSCKSHNRHSLIVFELYNSAGFVCSIIDDPETPLHLAFPRPTAPSSNDVFELLAQIEKLTAPLPAPHTVLNNLLARLESTSRSAYSPIVPNIPEPEQYDPENRSMTFFLLE